MHRPRYPPHKFKSDLPRRTQKKVHKIINSPSNLARIPGSVNGSKGAKVRNAMNGKRVKDRADRDGYMKQAYPQAKKIAKRLDRAYNKVGLLDQRMSAPWWY